MRIWPRFVRTPRQVLRDWRDMVADFIILALLWDLCRDRPPDSLPDK